MPIRCGNVGSGTDLPDAVRLRSLSLLFRRQRPSSRSRALHVPPASCGPHSRFPHTLNKHVCTHRRRCPFFTPLRGCRRRECANGHSDRGLTVLGQSGAFEVPTGVSSDCAAFLTSLNTDSGLDTCLSSITTATQSLNATDSISTDQLTASFTDLCSSDSACPTSSIRTLLNDFSEKCADDLVQNQDVSSTYDLLYNVIPMLRSVCMKDPASGGFCALQQSTLGKAQLELPTGDEAEIVMANLDAIGTANTGFLFMTPDTDTTALCSACFQYVMRPT